MICKHDKVYNTRMVLTTFPPQQAWICRKCGEEGIDIMWGQEADEYNELVRQKYDQKGEV